MDSVMTSWENKLGDAVAPYACVNCAENSNMGIREGWWTTLDQTYVHSNNSDKRKRYCLGIIMILLEQVGMQASLTSPVRAQVGKCNHPKGTYVSVGLDIGCLRDKLDMVSLHLSQALQGFVILREYCKMLRTIYTAA